MSEHTPGPWHQLTGGILTTSVLADHSALDKLIGIWSHEPNEANARLIASAPDLLFHLELSRDLLITSMEALEKATLKSQYFVGYAANIEEYLPQIEKTIAQAEGVTP